jgi:hypothetical protein
MFEFQALQEAEEERMAMAASSKADEEQKEMLAGRKKLQKLAGIKAEEAREHAAKLHEKGQREAKYQV